MNIYLRFTQQFNHGRLRAILSGGQAVVLHRLAMMSKDGVLPFTVPGGSP